MAKIILIIPYFGKLPNYFQVFLDSCANTNLVDFLIFTDDITSYRYPSNFKVTYESFDEFKTRIFNKIGDATIIHPYKLCDLKPAYGFILSDFIKAYNFWGHCDIDMIFGDIDKYLEIVKFENYDRIFTYGHLSIYRNSPEINLLFKTADSGKLPKIFDFNFVKSTTYPCNFDEVGMNYIFRNRGRFCESNYCGNINMNYYNYAVGDGNPKYPQLLVYEQGKMFVYEKKSTEIIKNEIMYLHLQAVKEIEKIDHISNHFIICRDGIIDWKDAQADYFFREYGQQNNSHLQQEKLNALRIKLRKDNKSKLKREIRVKKLNAIYTVIHRYKGLMFIKNNPFYNYV